MWLLYSGFNFVHMTIPSGKSVLHTRHNQRTKPVKYCYCTKTATHETTGLFI